MLPLTEDVVTEDKVHEPVASEEVVGEEVVQEAVTETASLSEPEVATETMTETVTETVTESVNEAAQASDPVKSAAEKNDEDGMASSAERMTILRMVEQGKISAEDGARLLAALSKGQEGESKPRPNPFDTSRHLQVRVNDLVTNRQKVNVTLPVGLLQWAWRWLPSSAQEQLEQVQAAIDSGASGRLVEVVDQDSGVRVEITLI